MGIQASGEMYLETILLLSTGGGPVRAVDISDHMGYSKPSVSRAMGLLKKEGCILVDKDGHITLTDTGRTIAETIYERHRILTRLLVELGVPEDIASEDACRMEHAISDASFQAIKRRMARSHNLNL